MVETERLFLAIELSDSARKGLTERVRAMSARAAKARWTPVDNIHVTLKFLGETPPERKAAVVEAMERAAANARPFEVSIAGVRIIRRRGAPRMVWATIADAQDQLRQLHERTEQSLERSGFPRDGRSFSPHVTLARVRDGIAPWERRLLDEWASAQRSLAPIALAVEDVVLMKSELKPGGAQYTVCNRFALQGT